MNNQALTIALSSVISLAGIWLLLFWAYSDYCVDRFRQRVFSLRDELFDAAAEGLIPFEHPAYGALRSTMNGFIRFGHRFSLLQFLLFSLGSSRDFQEANQVDSVEHAARSLDAQQRVLFDAMRSRMHAAMVEHLAIGSPVLAMMVLPPLVGLLLVRFCFSQVMSRLQGPFERMDSAAMAYGD